MLAPKKQKHRKHFQIKPKGTSTRGTKIDFGSFAMKSIESGWVSSRQIEASRRVITRYLQRGGKMWIRIFPDLVLTKKGGEIPMGKGKGAPDQYVAVVNKGRIIFELEGVTEDMAKKAIELAIYKMPIKCKFIKK